MVGLVWEMVAISWSRTEWTLSYQIATLRYTNRPLFFIVCLLMLWAVWHFLHDEIGGLRGLLWPA